MEPKQYVNGAMLGQNIGRSVCVVGKILSKNISRNEIKVSMCDDKEVDVILDSDDMHDPMYGYIQMVATVISSDTLMADAFVSLSGEIDLEIYNEAITVAAQYPNLFSASEVDGEAM